MPLHFPQKARPIGAVLAVLITATACSANSDGTAPSATGLETTSSAAFATPDADAGLAAVSCGSDVVYGDLPPDLTHQQITRYTELVIDGQTVMRFAIGSDVTEAQVERTVRLARFYLEDVPGST